MKPRISYFPVCRKWVLNYYAATSTHESWEAAVKYFKVCRSRQGGRL